MKASTLLRKAARYIEENNFGFGCHLIKDLKGEDEQTRKLALSFLMLFKPTMEERKTLPYNIDSEGFWGSKRRENIEDRIVGLCMAAAIAASFEKGKENEVNH